jgi:hypothetical protein
VPADRYWFPAKRYGWGWGPPSSWHGWVVLAVYTAVVAAAALADRPWTWLVVLGATVTLLVVCLRKGEPTSWRWGDRGRAR